MHPTELFYLENPKQVNFQKFVTQTLVNLISKDIIRIKKINTKDGVFTISNSILICGDNLTKYEPLNFEKIFVTPFKLNNKIEIELNHYFEKIHSIKFDKWLKELMKSDNLMGLINSQFTLNKKGAKKRNELLISITNLNSFTESKYFTLIKFNDPKGDLNAKKRINNLFLEADIDISLIDLIYETSIRVFSDSNENSKKYESDMNWRNYNTGAPGV